MFSLFLATLVYLFRIDVQPSLFYLAAAQQNQIIARLLQAPAQPVFHIQRTIGPVRRSYFVQPSQPISAQSGMAIDVMSGSILWQKNPQTILPVASLTKLATALVFLDTSPDFSQEVTMESGDDTDPDGSRLMVRPGETVTVGDLFNASLVGSANNATKAMVRSTALSEEEFVALMNAKARQLGLAHTKFYEVTGLDPRNTSTVLDYSRLASFAFRHSTIRETLNKREYTFTTVNTRKFHRINNTDQLLTDAQSHLIGAKTGYLEEAGYTFVAQSEHDGHQIMLVLFKSESSQQRFSEAKALIQWAETVFSWLSSPTFTN
jgi:D-alanyl-D-alanine endopeptidase (penicillin-binding protein 7)